MKLVFKLAFALSISSFASLATSPAAFAKKERKQAAAEQQKLNFSKEFIDAYRPAIDALTKTKDIPAAVSMLPALKAAIKNDDDRYEAGNFIVNVGAQAKDAAIQIDGINIALASSKIPADVRAKYLYFRGAFAYDAKDYVVAETFIKQALDGGYTGNDLLYLIANAQSQQGKYTEAQASMRAAIAKKMAAGSAVPSVWYAQAKTMANRQKDRVSELYWGRELVKVDKSPEAFHDAVFPFIAYNDLDPQELLDILRLARLAKSLLFEQEFRAYIDAADRKRNPLEVLTVIEEGVSKGLLNRSERTIAEAITDAQASKLELAKNWDTDEQYARKQANGNQAMLFADRLYSFGEFTRAASLYRVALEKGTITNREGINVKDQAWMRLAMCKVNLRDFVGAKTDLANINSPKRKMMAEYWNIYIDGQIAPSAPVAAKS